MPTTPFRRISRSACLVAGAALIAATLVAAPAAAQRSPEERSWRVSLESGKSALASGNLTVAENAVRLAIQQAMGLSPDLSKNLPLAESYETMAEIQAARGDFVQAENMLNQAITIRRNAQPADHPDLGAALIAVADMNRRQGKHDAADRIYRTSIDTIAAALGIDHILLARAYYGLARNDMAQGQTGAADGALLQAFAILGRQNEAVAREDIFDVRPFADAYVGMGRPDDAERVLRQALGLYGHVAYREVVDPTERHSAIEHPYFEETMMALGRLQLDRGSVEEARRTFDRGTDQLLLALGPGSERAAQTMETVAGLFAIQNHSDIAESFYNKAMEVRRRAPGETASDRVRGLAKLGDLYSQRGDTARAEELYRQAIQISEGSPADAGSVEAAHAHANLGLILWNRGEIDEAERLWRDALAGYERSLGPTDVNVATVAFNLGQLLHGQGRYGEAEPLYRQALEVRAGKFGPRDPRTQETVNMYGLLLDRVGRAGEADALRARFN